MSENGIALRRLALFSAVLTAAALMGGCHKAADQSVATVPKTGATVPAVSPAQSASIQAQLHQDKKGY